MIKLFYVNKKTFFLENAEEEDALDEMSTEAVFSKMKKPSPIKKLPAKPSVNKAASAKQKPSVAKSLSDNENKVKKADKPIKKPKKTLKEKNEILNASIESDSSFKLELNDDTDESPVKKVSSKKVTRKIIQKSTDDEEAPDTGPQKIIKKIVKQKKVSSKVVKESTDEEGEAKVLAKKTKSVNEDEIVSKKVVRTKKANKIVAKIESDDEELLKFVENNNGQLEQPKPLFELDSEGQLPKLPDFVYKILEKDFGHKSFRPHQAEAVLRVACGLSTVVVLSTGYGKSLIYQMAAKLYAKRYPGSCVLVISPLISLMQDQLYNLSKSLKAAVCDSQLNETQYQQLLQDLDQGKINILYMSPEAIINKKIKSIPRLAFVCIDEIHCLSQWSHNFRPSYLQLSQVNFKFVN